MVEERFKCFWFNGKALCDKGGISVSDNKFQNMRFKGHTGSKLIGRLSILGVEGYGFKSRFPDVLGINVLRAMIILPFMGILAILIIPREEIALL